MDDLTSARFAQYAIEIIKNDDFGIGEGMIHYPAAVIRANEDVKAVHPIDYRKSIGVAA